MRKTLAILFSFILLFAAGGYRIVLTVQIKNANRSLEAKIDEKQYNEADLVEFKVALNMPYQTRQTAFERHYGEININGTAYTYVERMVDGDTLVLKCIPNKEKQELKNTADALARSNSGQQQENNGKNQVAPILKLFSGDYDDKTVTPGYSISSIPIHQTYATYCAALCNGENGAPFQPPKC